MDDMLKEVWASRAIKNNEVRVTKLLLRHTKDPKTAFKLFNECCIQQAPLSLPPFTKELSLSNFLWAIFVNDDSSITSPGFSFGYKGRSKGSKDSNKGSCRRSDVDFSALYSAPNCDWSKIISLDGHLYLDQIISQLSPVHALSKVQWGLCVQSLNLALLGLTDYNAKHKGAEYELVAPLKSSAYNPGRRFMIHGNFLARCKNPCSSCSGSSSVQLFFAKMKNGASKLGLNPIVTCFIMKPQCPSADPVILPKYAHVLVPPCDEASVDE